MPRVRLSGYAAPVARVVFALAAVVSFTAIPGTAADRVVLAEDFTATW